MHENNRCVLLGNPGSRKGVALRCDGPGAGATGVSSEAHRQRHEECGPGFCSAGRPLAKELARNQAIAAT